MSKTDFYKLLNYSINKLFLIIYSRITIFEPQILLNIISCFELSKYYDLIIILNICLKLSYDNLYSQLGE